MPSLTERLAIIIDAKTGGAVKEFDKVAASAKGLEKNAGLGGKALEKLGLSGKISGDALRAGITTGVAAAGAAVAGFAISSVKHFQDAALGVRAFQRVTGQSAEEASHFVAAFDDMGISADTASSSMFKLSKNLSTGGKALTDLGIGIAHAANGSVDLKGTFLNVADAVSKTEDPTQRAAIAFAAFGKQGAALLPILEKGRKGIEELFKGADLNFSQRQLDQAEDFRKAIDHLGDSAGKVQNLVGAALVPSLSATADGLASLLDKADSATKSVGGLSTVFEAAIHVTNPIGFAMEFLGDKTDDAALSADDLANVTGALGTSMDTLTGKTKDQVLALLDDKAALEGLYSATLAQFDANFGYQNSLDATEDAATKLKEAQAALTQAIKDHTAASPEATAAHELLNRALLAQEEQALKSAEAAGRLAEQTAIAGGATDATLPKIDAQIAELKRQRDQIAGSGGNTEVIAGMISKLESLRAQYSTNVIVNGVKQATADVTGLQRVLNNLTGATARVTVSGTRPLRQEDLFGDLSGKASGGDVRAGTPYIVGEHRPELFVPTTNGTILPRLPTSAAGGNHYTIQVSPGIVGMTPAEIEDGIVRAIKRSERRNGPYRSN